MNNDIKEILKRLKDKNNYDNMFEAQYGGPDYYYFLEKEESHILLDYITNLQEENECLNMELNSYKDEFCKDTIKEYELVMEQEDYKLRCEKATEFIEKSRVKATPFFKQFDGDLIMPKREVDKLLIILNGGDSNE